MAIKYRQPDYKSPFTPHEFDVVSDNGEWSSCVHTSVANDSERRGWCEDEDSGKWLPPQHFVRTSDLFDTADEAICHAERKYGKSLR